MISTGRSENLHFLLRCLLDELKDCASVRIPTSPSEQRNLLRSFLNVRPPRPVSKEFQQAQDRELQWQLEEKGIVTLSETAVCSTDRRLRLWQGDITRLQVDAIVNAANSAMLGCFVPMHNCIDNAIHSAAGVQLRLECDALMKKQGCPEPTGKAKITSAYNLPARYVLHTVGPIVRGGKPTHREETELSDCYSSCLALADAHALKSIAFCCISTGVFGFPQLRAAEIAVDTVRQYLDNTAGTNIKSVVFNVFKDDDLSIYKKLVG